MADWSSIIPGETRIRDEDGFCGTVVYVGPVASSKKTDEIYAGIVWDDANRGKHDGSVICRTTQQIVRHFPKTCACGPTQGSFLKWHKMDLGVALTTELLREKYVEMQAPIIAPNNLLPHTARTSSGKEKPIEFLGELKIRKQQQLEQLDKISLRRLGISRATKMNDEDYQKTKELYGNQIRDMDLAGNLFSNWTEVLNIMQQFPALEEFSVAFNRIGNIPTSTMTMTNWSFDRVQVLNLNHCSITSFKTIQWVGTCMPNLKSLCIASADLSDITNVEGIQGFEQLQVLDCSNCHLTSWEGQVQKFGTLPKLEQLSLDDNPISSIVLPSITTSHATAEDGSCCFPSLKSLQLAGTSISSWMDIEQGMNQLNIKSLRLKNTPLTSSMGQGEVRFLAIARFPTLEYLNASKISPQERVEAERRYVSLVHHLLVLAKQSNHENKNNTNNNTTTTNEDCHLQEQEQVVLQQHPQYSRLREKYKNLIVSTTSNHSSSMSGGGNNDGPTTLASNICNLKIISMASASCTMEPLVKRLPGSLTVGRLKALCARAFGLDVDLMTLHFRTTHDAFPVELDNNDNTLTYYGVCDGAEILMNEMDIHALQNQKELQAREQERKIIQQEQNILTMQELKRRNMAS